MLALFLDFFSHSAALIDNSETKYIISIEVAPPQHAIKEVYNRTKIKNTLCVRARIVNAIRYGDGAKA